MRGSIHHLDLTVQDVGRSASFYDAVLQFLGYERVRDEPNGIDWNSQHGLYSVGIKPACRVRAHDRYTCGLHHFALRAESRDDVDRLYALLIGIGATVLDPPAEYPQYGRSYYAVFFADPDGLKIEFVHQPPKPQPGRL